MINKEFRNIVIASVLAAALVIAGTGCNKKLTETSATSDVAQTTLDPMSFAAIDARIRDYNFGINEYMREHSAEATQKKVSGTTFNGIAAESTYTISPDGKYEFDGSAEAVTKIIDLNDSTAEDVKKNNDLYFSFDEIRAIYA